jgi:formate-dependent nitrite reductase membrane component NrfD
MPAGHWVVMKAKIGLVGVLAITYVWSHRSCPYFVSTCGSTYLAEQSYTTHFEDEFGMVSTKQTHLLEWVFDFLPLIDEHNRQQQTIANLERKWCCWFRLLVTIVGMSVVDLFRIYLNQEKEKYKTVNVVEFLDLICREINLRQSRHTPP